MTGQGKTVVIDIEQLRSRLEISKKQLRGELAQLLADGRPTADRREGSPFGKREEEATESNELERRLAMERGVEDQLADIDSALSKITAGTYGKCESCGKKIEHARLEALPHARLCLSCKGLHARNAKSR
jgi:DnaK suppressor protein